MSAIIACTNRHLFVCFSTSLLYFTILQTKTSGKGITRVVVLFWQIPRTMNDLSGVKETRPWSQKITRVIDTSFHVHYIRPCADTVETDMHHASLVTHKRSTETFTAPLFTRRALPRPTKSVKYPPLTRPNGVYKKANEINSTKPFFIQVLANMQVHHKAQNTGRRKIYRLPDQWSCMSFRQYSKPLWRKRRLTRLYRLSRNETNFISNINQSIKD